MTFQVETADLRGYAGLLKRQATHNDQILWHLREYCGRLMRPVYSEGLFAKVLDVHDDFYADAERLIIHLGNALRNSATELEKAAKAYDGADSAAKQRLETAINWGPVRAREGWEASHSGYADYVGPTDLLHHPNAREIHEIDKIIDKIGDGTSITGMVLGVVEALTGRKPVEECVQFLTGDWKAFSEAADAFWMIGSALEAIGKNVDRGNASMDHAWHGGASEHAYAVFDDLARAFKQQKAQFYQLSRAYQEFSRFVQITAAALADTIKMICDIVIEYLLRKKGGPLADAYILIYELKIVKNIAHLGYIMLTARGAFALMLGDRTVFEARKLPPAVRGSGYDAPGV